MNKLLAISLFGVILTGCLFSSAVFGVKTELYVAKRQADFYQQAVIIKTNKANNPYDLWANSYNGDGFGSNPPNTLTINYAIIPWEKDRAWSMGLDNYIKLQADKLPPSAWRTYTIYPKQLLDKGTSMPIWDTRYDKVADDQKAKSRVTVTLYIDGNGKVSQNIERTLVLSDSVW